MRVVLDTNILVSSILVEGGPPDIICSAWLDDDFSVLTCAGQIAELGRTLRKPALISRLRPYKAGRLMNDLMHRAENIDTLPRVDRSPDPDDDFFLAIAEAGQADYLVTGDKSDLLSLRKHRGTPIVTARHFANLLIK